MHLEATQIRARDNIKEMERDRDEIGCCRNKG